MLGRTTRMHTGKADAVLANPEMAALYFGGTVGAPKDQAKPVARA